MTDFHDTIVALSSAPGPGGRAIVRLSGQDAIQIVTSLFTSAVPVTLQRRRWEGAVRFAELASDLPAELYVWPAPRSYTSETIVELHVLSCPPLVERLIGDLLQAGARAARPGEFTLRGFLAGKLDLTRAEAVLGVIEAGSRDELRHALGQLAGGVTRPLHELREDLLNLLADVEAGLDFSDEDLEFARPEDILLRIGKGLALVTLIGKQIDQRAVNERPFRAVLAGRPNAGKSSLFNALGGLASALVSDEAGTTRDYLIKQLEIDGVAIEVVDTAGRRIADVAIEAHAQALGREQAESADLVLLCIEAGQQVSEDESALLAASAPPGIHVSTKCDLLRAGRVVGRPPVADAPGSPIRTSARTGQGLSELRCALVDRARVRHRPALAPSLSRCRHHVSASLDHLRRAHAGVLHNDPPEVLALELRAALDQLGEMVGAVYTDDLLDRVFSRFCIGK